MEPEQRERVEQPPRWRVLLLNDDFTTMDFVIEVLQGVFGHDYAAAFHIMLRVHRAGSGLAGVYRREVAEAKVAQVHALAQDAGHPLRCVCEPE